MTKLITIYNMAQPSNNIPPYTFEGGQSPTLMGRMGTGGNQVPIVHEVEINGVGLIDGEKTNTLDASYWKGQGTRGNQERVAVMDNVKRVRRLTPIECERLQGLPDNFTDIPLNGKPASDSARYKALGNGMAQPVADFVLRRIAEVSDDS